MVRRLVIYLLTGVFILSACHGHKRSTEASFYYWKTRYKISAEEEKYLSDLNIKTLYIRYFDVNWDAEMKQVVPVAEIKFQSKPTLNVIPVIYITNATLDHINDSLVVDLAGKIFNKINEIHRIAGIRPFSEIQIDCDWTLTNRNKYFLLLNRLALRYKDKSVKVSVTLRLHQVKYMEKTGVPPVDKVVLMFYNMGKADDLNSKNAILDLEISKKYISYIKNYPLKMDVALPLYSRVVLIRLGRVINMFNDLDHESVDSCHFISKLKEGIYKVDTSSYLNGYYFYKNDILKVESTTLSQISNAALLLDRNLKNEDIRVIFFHLDEGIIKKYGYETIQDICHLLN